MADFNTLRNTTKSNFNKVKNESRKNGSSNNNRNASSNVAGDPFRQNLTEMEKKRRREEKRKEERSLFPSELLIDPRVIALRERMSDVS